MSSEEIEPDAYSFERYFKMKTDSETRYAPKHPDEWIDEVVVDVSIVPESIDPLFSAETINDKVRFEQQARELEGLARRMEAALSKPVDRESMLELVQDLYSKADELAEVGEVFSNEQ